MEPFHKTTTQKDLKDCRSNMLSQLTELMAFIDRLMLADSNVSQVEVLCGSFQTILDMFVDTNAALATCTAECVRQKDQRDWYEPRAKAFWTFVFHTKNWCAAVKNGYALPKNTRLRMFGGDTMRSTTYSNAPQSWWGFGPAVPENGRFSALGEDDPARIIIYNAEPQSWWDFEPAVPENGGLSTFGEDMMASSDRLSQANITFCLDLFKRLCDKNKTANVFFSPCSISSALATVMLGARGNTATQISEVLRFMEPDFHTKFKKLLSELNKADVPHALIVANRLYAEKSYTFVKDFLEKNWMYYDMELEIVDFQMNSEAARLHINSWVARQTQDKIKGLLERGALNRLTKLVLVNAVYFKGTWKDPFDKGYTRDAHFKLNRIDTKPVKMMHLHKAFRYTVHPELNFQILELPYEGGELSMLIFLPMDIMDSSTGLEQLEKELTYESFREWTSPHRMRATDILVALPRFKIEEKYDMEDVLVSMGIVDAFDAEKSDFSGMSSANNLALSKVIHKACMDVNEEGSVTAAASVNWSNTFMASASMKTFIADHPFLFFIRHNPPFWTNNGGCCGILFAGRYCSPE